MTPEIARSFLQPVKDALRDVWVEGQVDVFDVGFVAIRQLRIKELNVCRSSKEVTRIDQLAEQVGSTQGFFGLLDAILNVVIFASDSTVVTLRTKALRALGQVVASNPKILKNVRLSN
jgi:cohesin loading factor subunit SCC2